MQIRKLLYPFSLLYAGITSVRNKCFDAGILRSKGYSLPIISIGNITVGGTGKTPLTEYLIRILISDHKLTLLSRGYKRKTKGALLANKSSNAETIGDEPFQIKSKFPSINVAVAEKRVEGMNLILKNLQTDVVLMDDAYQHRYVKPGLSLLVIDYNRPLWKDCPFPAGDLRETRNGQKRADIIVVNKCPENFSDKDKAYWLKKLKASDDQQVFFTSISYGLPKAVDKNNKESFQGGMPVVALAGIARPEGFIDHLKNNYKVHDQLIFPDHHHFSSDDVDIITRAISDEKIRSLITTEKDAVRFHKLPDLVKGKAWYIPIELRILFSEQEKFENIIRNYVRDHSNYS
ncbi:tetraacyldisaccharide 4'-kinase [Carboxylicivirga sp. RSCT41]|uniref:tetraacyldisaccharide 4'-kinase n=1 Tax=Carboxylicivirga agarovorans TaxID=3417570 RepID=UPI003D32D2C9